MDRTGLIQTDAPDRPSAAPLVIQLNSFATPARTQDLLRSLAFRNSGNNPGASRNFSVFVQDDQSNTSNTQWVGLTIATDNEAPVLAGGGTSLQEAFNGRLRAPLVCHSSLRRCAATPEVLAEFEALFSIDC